MDTIYLAFILILMIEPAKALSAEKTESRFLQFQLRELSRREKLIERQSHPSDEQKRKDAAKAYEYYSSGRSLFNRGGYVTAQEAFEKAILLDASVDNYYYDYGISLYKNGKYERALAVLSLLEGSVSYGQELPYYQALSHFKLNEEEFALQKFLEVKEQNHQSLSPLSAMYAGLLLQKQKKYQEAKDNFQYILDTSKDPKLDALAEKNLESIIALEQREIEQGKRWSITFYTGMLYDGNVLNIADNFSTSDLSAYRTMYGGTVDYRFLNREQDQWLARFSASDMYSLNNKFKADSTLQSVDPLQLNVSLPYIRYSKTSILSISPNYQQIYMSLDETGRNLVYSIAGLESSYVKVKAGAWMSEYKIEVSRDTFHAATTLENDQTATKFTVSTTQSKLFDSAGKKTAFVDLTYTLNNARGVNSKYNRPMLSLGASYPLSDSFLAFTKADFYVMDYSQSITDRKDNGFIISLGGNYDITSRWTWTNNLQYFNNNSTVDGYDYRKVAIMSLITYRTGFF